MATIGAWLQVKWHNDNFDERGMGIQIIANDTHIVVASTVDKWFSWRIMF
jgi:hypothetical protein